MQTEVRYYSEFHACSDLQVITYNPGQKSLGQSRYPNKYWYEHLFITGISPPPPPPFNVGYFMQVTYTNYYILHVLFLILGSQGKFSIGVQDVCEIRQWRMLDEWGGAGFFVWYLPPMAKIKHCNNTVPQLIGAEDRTHIYEPYTIREICFW